MALTTPPLNNAGKAAGFKQLDPAKYTSLGDFIDQVNKPDNRDLLVKTYGNQGITGFLKMTGAVKANGTSDQVQYWEESRLHLRQKGEWINSTSFYIDKDIQDDAGTGAPDGDLGDTGDVDNASVVRVNDVILHKGDRYVVTAISTASASNASVTVTVAALGTVTAPTAGDALESAAAAADGAAVIGNLHAQGSDQPSEFIESNVILRTNPYMILKETFKVSGSQATNIGWINVGNGDYRWYVKGEMDTRQRFLDKREMMMLLGKNNSVTVGGKSVQGSEGYFSAIEDRGIVTSGTDADFATLGDIDAIITELDKQGAAPEYAIYANTATMLALDDMIASSALGATVAQPTIGAQAFGAFQNDPQAAVRLGFSSFRRGGYTFHSKSWKLLNDPTLLAGHGFKGVMIPLTTVVDPKSGNRAAALEMNYKAANGYSREMEHWMTGSILGVTNANEDSLQFNYRSECNLITRAANQHVLIK